MINVGGPQNTDCRIKPGETTFVKITFFNNAGFDWHLKAGAITSDEITIKIRAMDNNFIINIKRNSTIKDLKEKIASVNIIIL